MKNAITDEILSRKFSELVLAELTEEQKAAVLAHSKDDECCITHDFIDPNQSMIDAYESLAGEDLDCQDSGTQNLVNAAWAMARANDWWV